MMYNLDTCAVVDFLRSNKPVTKKILEANDNKEELAICSITYYEVVRGFDKMKPTRKQVIFEQLYAKTEHLPLNEKSLDIAAEIYRYLCKRGQKIEDADILIAAITLANDAILVTDNVKHFERMPNLKFVNWKDLGGNHEHS